MAKHLSGIPDHRSLLPASYFYSLALSFLIPLASRRTCSNQCLLWPPHLCPNNWDLRCAKGPWNRPWLRTGKRRCGREERRVSQALGWLGWMLTLQDTFEKFLLSRGGSVTENPVPPIKPSLIRNDISGRNSDFSPDVAQSAFLGAGWLGDDSGKLIASTSVSCFWCKTTCSFSSWLLL